MFKAKIRKTCGLFISVGILLLVSPFVVKRIQRNDAINLKEKHHLDSVQLDPDDEKWLKRAIYDVAPGTLVCSKQKSELGFLTDVSNLDDELEDVISPRISLRKSNLISISRQSQNRPMGCCPPGNPFGKVYKLGFACCKDEIFDVTMHFCCISTMRVMELNENNINNCDPFLDDATQHCRVEDLKTDKKLGMIHECRFDSDGKPLYCEFSCPQGSLPANNIKNATCTSTGKFDNIPLCCQGCKKGRELNVWFLIQIRRDNNNEKIDVLKSALKDFISNLIIGEKNAKVGFRMIGDEKNEWNLHSSRLEARKAIDELNIKDGNRKIGQYLSRLARHGLRQKSENNVVVTILQEPPDDTIFKGAKEVKSVARSITIGIGNVVSEEDLSAIATFAEYSHKSDFSKLIKLSPKLLGQICGTECI